MRRLTWLAPLLLAVALLATPTAASADVAAVDEDTVVLAAEADGEPLGPDPQPRDAEGNAARELAGYETPEIQFTWAASFILLGAAVTGLVVGGGLWYLLVVRPNRESAGS
jgi:hypothetical protein